MLSIKRIKIDNYGGISDKQIELKDGLNVIYGKNESGKSTIRSFIHAIFYGLKNSSEKADRKRYMPWGGGNMSGSANILLDGREIEIRRTFGKTASSDKFSVSDAVSGEELFDIRSSEAGEKLLGVSENVFLKTAYIKQGGAVTEGADEEITARLINLATSGNEDVSAEGALSAIERAKRRLKAKNKTYSSGVIDNLSERKNALIEERFSAKRLEERLAARRGELVRLKERERELADEIKRVGALERRRSDIVEIKEGELLARLGEDIDALRKNPLMSAFDGFDEEQSRRLEQKAARIRELSDITDKERNLTELSTREENLGEGKDAKTTVTMALLGGLAVLLVVLGIIFGTMFGKTLYLLCGAGVIAAFACAAVFVSARKGKVEAAAKREELQSEIERLKSEIDEAKGELGSLCAELDSELERLGASCIENLRERHREYIKLKAVLDVKESNYVNLLNGRDAEKVAERVRALKDGLDVSEEDIERAAEQLDRLNAERDETDRKIRKCDFEIENAPSASVSDIDCEIKTLDEELEMFSFRLEALETAESEINAAFDEVRGSFGSVLNDAVNSRLEKITDGKYTEAKVSKDYKLRLVCADGSLQYASALSAGTYEQIYIALRLGIAKLICGDNIIITADDICAQYDDERAENTIKLLKELSEEMQIIMFTCHERDAKTAERLGGVNIIKI